jgi:hypothetical protein
MTRFAVVGVGALLGLALATNAFAWGSVSGPRGGATCGPEPRARFRDLALAWCALIGYRQCG